MGLHMMDRDKGDIQCERHGFGHTCAYKKGTNKSG